MSFQLNILYSILWNMFLCRSLERANCVETRRGCLNCLWQSHSRECSFSRMAYGTRLSYRIMRIRRGAWLNRGTPHTGFWRGLIGKRLKPEFTQLSLGKSIAPQRTRKNRAEWIKKPFAVGQPPASAIVIIQPNTFCVIRNVSGFAMRKKMRVE